MLGKSERSPAKHCLETRTDSDIGKHQTNSISSYLSDGRVIVFRKVTARGRTRDERQSQSLRHGRCRWAGGVLLSAVVYCSGPSSSGAEASRRETNTADARWSPGFERLL